jgi:SAM-dependent methyltransferase
LEILRSSSDSKWDFNAHICAGSRSLALQSVENAYDAVAYPSLPFTHTHPSNLAAMAILHGLKPTPVDRCRVLEIACNEGGNIIPMAYAIPGSEFVGFDLAGLPVGRGQERIRELGLTNIRIFAADLMDVGAELGSFDYIIAHGLYSWVPEPVRDRLLGVCGQLLTPDGVAFISYNALPGGYMRNMVREMMLDRMKGQGNVEEQISYAIGFVRRLIETRAEGDWFRISIEEHLNKMGERSPRAIYHDELSEAHQAVSFVDFAKHARAHGLQYLSEAVLPPPPDPCYRVELRAELERVSGGDFLEQEQMLDFARARKYRETLLSRADRTASREFEGANLRRLMFTTPATSSPGESRGSTIFTLPSGIRMESNHPVATALMRVLEMAKPHALTLEEVERSVTGTKFTLDSDDVTLLMRLVVSKFIGVHGWKASLASGISERPRASACSRQEIRTGSQATTLLHSVVKLEEPIARSFLGLLDGTRDRGELAAALKAEYPEEPAEEIETRMEPSLEFFYRAGFLEA